MIIKPLTAYKLRDVDPAEQFAFIVAVSPKSTHGFVVDNTCNDQDIFSTEWCLGDDNLIELLPDDHPLPDCLAHLRPVKPELGIVSVRADDLRMVLNPSPCQDYAITAAISDAESRLAEAIKEQQK